MGMCAWVQVLVGARRVGLLHLEFQEPLHVVLGTTVGPLEDSMHSDH